MKISTYKTKRDNSVLFRNKFLLLAEFAHIQNLLYFCAEKMKKDERNGKYRQRTFLSMDGGESQRACPL